MEDDLNKLFAELDHQQIHYFIYRRNNKTEVELSIKAPHSDGPRESLSVRGEASTLREALADAFYRIQQMAQALSWQPMPTVERADDEIPF